MPITGNADLLDGDILYEGEIAYIQDATIRSGTNAEASTIIPFGRAVVKGTADDDLLLPVDANSVLMGIAVRTTSIEGRDGYSIDTNGDMGYPVDYRMGYLTSGVIAVKLGGAVTPASDVYWVHTTNGASVKGTFRADADTANAVQVTAARFLDSGAAGDVVRLALNLA